MQSRLYFFGIALLSLFLFLKVDPGFESVEKRVYTRYAISLVEDLDFNLVNQIPKKDAWLLSSSFNYPDMHSNGSSVLWAPILYSAKLFGHPATELGKEHFYLPAQALANVFWGILTIPLLWLLLMNFFPRSVCVKTLCVLFFCTPFYWYLLYQPENADISALFMSTLLVHLYVQRSKFQPVVYSFIFGLALFACVAVKFDLVFAGLLFVPFLLEVFCFGWLRIGTCLTAFFAGCGLALAPIMINEYLKNGFFNYAYMDTVSNQTYVLKEILISPSGYFVTHPFYAILICYFIFLSLKKNHSLDLWFFLAVPLTKLVLEGFNYSQNETFGPRHWLDDSAFFALLLGAVFQRLESKRARMVLYFLCGTSALISILAATVYRTNYDAYFYTGDWIGQFHRLQISDLYFWYELPWLHEKWGMFFLIAPLAAFAAYFSCLSIKWLSPQRIVGWFLLYTLLFSAATAANCLNNKKSILLIPSNVLDTAVIGRGTHINSFFENAGSLQKAITYYERRGESLKAASGRKILDEYVIESAKEIIRDPVHFRERLVPGRAKYLPDDLWGDE